MNQVEFNTDNILINDVYLFEGIDKLFFLNHVIESDSMTVQVDEGTPDAPYSYEMEVETNKSEIWDSLTDEQQSHYINVFLMDFKNEAHEIREQ